MESTAWTWRVSVLLAGGLAMGCWGCGPARADPEKAASERPPVQCELRRSVGKGHAPRVWGTADQAFVEVAREIGALTLRAPEGGRFPKAIRLLLRVAGLESLKLRKGDRTAEFALSSVDPFGQRATLREDAQAPERPIEKGHAWWARLEIITKEGQLENGPKRIPLGEGEWIEVGIPAALLEGEEEIEVEWVDFYR
ncbi:MAG TPA: hypothetical protein VMN36_17645 [Verrucomicrobiales bacterium]|nr:hypothetical protein [Verrucomicrobiales bacterium]